MKKMLTLLLACGLMLFISNYYVTAQDGDEAAQTEATETTDTEAETEEAPPAVDNTAAAASSDSSSGDDQRTFVETLKKYFIDGGWGFMSLPLICLILGLALCIERILMLNLATTNTSNLLKKVEDKFQDGDLDGAKEVCKATRGPVATIFKQGLERTEGGLDLVEKSIVSQGSVEMGKLERGLSWIALFIALAPMLGFMGTVIGMIEAFDAIQQAGDISPGLVAGGIKVALLTTLFGLVVAIILQIFYNYLVSKVDGIVNSMEAASISFVDLLNRYNIAK